MGNYIIKIHQFITPEELSPFSLQAHTCCQEKVGGPDDMNIVLFEERNLCLFFSSFVIYPKSLVWALKSFGEVTSLMPVGLFV